MNLIIVLICEKLKIVIDNKFPLTIQAEARKRWEVSDEITRCYMLASMTSTLYKQLESYKTTKPITLVKDHVTTLMGYFAEAADNEENLDQNSQIEMVFKSLSKDFASFRAAYNLGNKNLMLKQLMK
ncbi:uncharacterized protein LOC108459259 [Gossypium arboreum]|uniref:uncharacterized protein LOC108459259 n=1 Tax=Gossypium arboreum TaxID=29729 RepID=UPI0008196149|nr:uncharacterized protein LOC108459259 [Gossypium arboreum]